MRAIFFAAALSAIALSGTAEASTSYDFRVNLTSGPLAGRSFYGSFDVGALPISGTYDYTNPAGLGIVVTVPSLLGWNADATFLSFDHGQLVDFSIGGFASGYDLIDAGNPATDFLISGIDASYKRAGDGQYIYGGDTVRFQASVPEPGVFALFGLSVASLVARRASHLG